jgi:hypothetical protein
MSALDATDFAFLRIRETATSCVGLLMSNHMIGNTHPGGFHDGLSNWQTSQDRQESGSDPKLGLSWHSILHQQSIQKNLKKK